MTTIETRVAALERKVEEMRSEWLRDQQLSQVEADRMAYGRAQWGAIPQEEKDAGRWKLEVLNSTNSLRWLAFRTSDYVPTWAKSDRYRVVKTAAHPDNDRHARVKLAWEKIKNDRTFSIWSRNSPREAWQWCDRDPDWKSEYYEIRNDAQNALASKKKLIDKSKLPIGTMTNFGRLMDHRALKPSSRCRCWSPEYETNDVAYSDLRILPMAEWIHWTGGECPVPEGLRLEIEFRDGETAECAPAAWSNSRDGAEHSGDRDVIAYRILGVYSGYTDDEREAA